jgi:hypothetical protein
MSWIPGALNRNHYIVNIGSLGQPRDGSPDAAFIVYDSEERTDKIHRFEYDLSSTQHKIRENGLPSDSAERRKDDNTPFIYIRALLTLIRGNVMFNQ